MNNETNNGMDTFLKRRLQGVPSTMPDGMLAKIMAAREKKKRRMFIWLNFTVVLYCTLLSAGVISGRVNPLSGILTIPTEKTKLEAVPAQKEIASENAKPTESSVSEEAIQSATPAPGMNESSFPNAAPAISATGQPSAGMPANGFGTPATPINTSDPAVEVNPPAIPSPEPIPDFSQLRGCQLSSLFSAILFKGIGMILPGFEIFQKGKTKKADTPTPPKTALEIYLTGNVGVINEKMQSSLTEQTSPYVPEYFPTIINQGLQSKPAAAIQFGTEIKYGHLYGQTGLQVSRIQYKSTYEYRVTSIPVYDLTGKINGYLALDSVAQFNINGSLAFGDSSNLKQSLTNVYIPFSLGYSGNLGKWEYHAAAGVCAEIRTGGTIKMPSPRNPQFSQVFSFPLMAFTGQFQAGIGRNFGKWRAGVTANYVPGALNNLQIVNLLKLDIQRSGIGASLSYRLYSRH
jgi:hypothetical protein